MFYSVGFNRIALRCDEKKKKKSEKPGFSVTTLVRFVGGDKSKKKIGEEVVNELKKAPPKPFCCVAAKEHK